MAAKLPFKYTGAVVLGSNISGTLTSIISILTSFFASSVKTAAIYYFIGAMFVLLACFDTYFALPLNVSLAIRPHIEKNPLINDVSCLHRDFIDITNSCTKKRRRRTRNLVQVSQHVRHIFTFSERRFHNYSTFSLYFSSH